MIKVLSICLFIFIIQSKLLQVVSIFRHGARYYLNNYYDGNSSRQLWGQLTAVGMRQQQTLGKMIRTEYIDRINFLSDFYVEDEIDMISTVANRTIQSARSQLYGLYPLEKGKRIQKVPNNYLIPPYSNSTDSLQQEYALPSGHVPFVVKANNTVLKNYCKDRALLIKKNIDSQKVIYDEMYITYLPFMKKLGNIFNISSDSMNFSKVADIYDTLTVDRFLGRPFPPNITEQDYINMKHLNQWYAFLQLSYNLSKAINTNKFQRVIQNFDGRIKDSNQKLKWTFISAHDTDIIPMLIGLNFSQINCIEQLYRKGKTQALNCDSSFQYASSIIIQLHSGADQNDQTIKIRKDGKYMYLCETKEYSCNYAKWRQLIKNSFINVDELCNNPVNKQQIESDQSLYAN